MNLFNLLDEKWIPCATEKGVREVGLREALTQAHTLGDVQARSPLETAALMRLLLALAHRICGPADIAASAAMLRAGQLPRDVTDAYLDTWQEQFDLFGARPFLQIGGLTMAQSAPLAALATEAATGNNATLFDHALDSEPPPFTPAEAARRLVAAQAFALGFGKAAEAVVDGKAWPRPYLADAICLRGVTVWLSGKSLFETLMLNMVTGEERADLPLWERKDPLERLDKAIDGKRVAVKAKSATERYLWQSRMVHLLPETEADGQTVVRRAFFTQGREADKAQGDPMKVFVQSRTEGIYALSLNAGKASWRDLHSLLMFHDAPSTIHRPKILEHAAGLVQEGALPRAAFYGFNVVGLATDPGKAGKFLLWRHDRLSIPAALLEEALLVDVLGLVLEEAEFVAGELRERTWAVAKRFVPPFGNPDPKDVAHLADALNPRPAYWARLETHFHALLAQLPLDWEQAARDWRRQVALEAKQALHEACNQLGLTPRAQRAKATTSFFFDADKAAVTQQRAERKAQAQLKKRKDTNSRERTTPSV